jgi:hypothetical protein
MNKFSYTVRQSDLHPCNLRKAKKHCSKRI